LKATWEYPKIIILGKKYKFTQLELERLNKKFNNITPVKYRNRLEEEVLQELEDATNHNDFDILVHISLYSSTRFTPSLPLF